MKSNSSMRFIIFATIKSSVKKRRKKEIYLFCHATSLNICIFWFAALSLSNYGFYFVVDLVRHLDTKVI